MDQAYSKKQIRFYKRCMEPRTLYCLSYTQAGTASELSTI